MIVILKAVHGHCVNDHLMISLLLGEREQIESNFDKGMGIGHCVVTVN